MEGHFITGFGDGSVRPLDAEPLEVTARARDALQGAVAADPQTAARTTQVLDLVGGFEGTYDLELLASVHWAIAHEHARDPQDASRIIRRWTSRKAGLFDADHVTTAWDALERGEWIRQPVHA